jgi:hypothetical protein
VAERFTVVELMEERPVVAGTAVMDGGGMAVLLSLLLLPLFLFFSVFLLLFLTVQGCFNDGEDGDVVAEERKHSGGAQVVRNGPSSPLCSDPPSLCSSLFFESFPPLFFSFGFSFSVPSLCSVLLPSLSLPFSSSPKFCPPWFPFFFSSSPLHFLFSCPQFIGSRGEVHHTLYKHRAWWPGHGSSPFRYGGGHGSPVSPLMRVWVV